MKNKCVENTSFKNKYSIGNFENYFGGNERTLFKGRKYLKQKPRSIFCYYSQPIPVS